MCIANNVKAMMARHGVTPTTYTLALQQILECDYSSAHRKLAGTVNWSIEQVKQIAACYKETAAILIEDMENIEIRNARLIIEAIEVNCLLWIGQKLEKPFDEDLVAICIENQWKVIKTSQANINTDQLYQIIRIEYAKNTGNKLKLAIIDDDAGVADNLKEYMNGIGFDSTTYYSSFSALNDIEKTEYDAYIVDWILENSTAKDIITKIRAIWNKNKPIVILTGELDTDGSANENEVAQIVRRFDASFQMKPAKLSILAAELSKLLNAHNTV